MLGTPRLQVTSTLQEEPTLTVTKRVYNNFQNTEKIDYQWTLKNDTLCLDHYFSSPKQSILYKQPKVTLRLQLPETYSIVLDPSVNQSMDVENLPEENRIDSDITEED